MSVVKIKRIRVNFQIRFGYIPALTDYLKKVPRDQCQTKMEPILQPNGQTKEDWFRICNSAGLAKILWYCWDNGLQIEYENVKDTEIVRIEEFANSKKKRFENAKRLKNDGFNIDNIDYSFMKKPPHPYQKEAVEFFEAVDGIALLGDQPGVGKSLKINELVCTEGGWKQIGNLKIGDLIFHHDGTCYPVSGIFPQGKLDTYRVFLNDDFYLDCSMDHLWMVRDVNRRKRGRGWVVKTLKELVDGSLHYDHNQNRADSGRKPVLKWEIPLVQPIQYNEKQYLIHPYILGALIGDGDLSNNCTRVSIPDFQLEIKECIEKYLPDTLRFTKHENICPQYAVVQKKRTPINIFNREIKRLGLSVKSHQKFIPVEYLTGSVEQRIDLLKGLMDTDGSADKNRINYHTISKQLAYDVAELVQSLGGQAIVKSYDRTLEGKSIEWRVTIRINICPFNLENKIKEWKPAKRNYASRYISHVELLGQDEHVCIRVESPDHTFVVKNYIVTHNTLSAIAYAVKNQFKTLVICPASLKLYWRDEILGFTYEKPHIYKYTLKKKEKKEGKINFTPEESLIHIINYESLETYLKFEINHKCQETMCDFEETSMIKKHKFCPKCFKEKSVKSRITDLCKFEDKKGNALDVSKYDLIVLDEAHYIKNESAGRTKIVKRAFGKMPRKILMTGTAIKSKPKEFFTLLNFLDEFEWVNAHNFGVKYCDGFQDKFDHWHYDGYSNIDELYERISYLFLRRLKKDILKFLPPKTYTIIPIEMSAEETREYRRLEKGIIDETDEADEKMTHLARIQMLKQFTSKLNAERACEFIQNIIDGDEKVVVFTQFVSTSNYLYEKFKDCAVLFNGKCSQTQKAEARDRFLNDDTCKVFVGTIGAAGVGITLTSSSTLIFIDQPWTPSDREQAEDRIHRASQTADKCQIIRLIAQETIDEDIEELLNEKEKVTSQVLDGVVSTKEVKHSIFDDIVSIILRKKYA